MSQVAVPPADRWDEHYSRGLDFMPVSTAELKMLPTPSQYGSSTALDIGCGTGQMARELFHKGYSVTGVDSSSVAVHRAREVSKRGLSFVHADVETVDLTLLAGFPFELVTCRLVLAFIHDRGRFTSKIAGSLTVGGVLCITTPTTGSVAPEKAAIAVDADSTADLLAAYFSVRRLPGPAGSTVFLCRRPRRTRPGKVV